MKKLLMALAALTSMAIANDLPLGHFAGTLKTPKGAIVAGQGDSNPAGVIVHLEALPDLGSSTGDLTANVNMSQSDCFAGTGNLHLDHPFMLISNFAITASDCVLNGNTFTGSYKVTYLPLLTGTFSFTTQ